MQWTTHAAPSANCLSADGSARSIARRIAHGACAPGAALTLRAREVMLDDCRAGCVHSLGAWHDGAVHVHLGNALGPVLAPALRADFEWYQCRGAFFHNDAHYDARLFGIWCIVGPTSEVVFPRAGVRHSAGPGNVVVFDPFEVHGVLRPDCGIYSADDYQTGEANIFVGFELDITTVVAEAFGITPGGHDRMISSKTRIAADSGGINFD